MVIIITFSDATTQPRLFASRPIGGSVARWTIISPMTSTAKDRATRSQRRSSSAIRQSYLVCAVPRSGSYLLCEGLRNTGIAGNPTEYFSSKFRDYWAPRWGTSTFDAYLERVARVGMTPNGVFGAKAHAGQFDYFARQASGRIPVPHVDRPALLDRWLPDMHYIRLRRRDRLRQAVSYVKAIQSNVWWDAERPPAPYDAPRPEAVRFDYLLIEHSMVRLAEEDDRWTRYFGSNRITPLTVDYEDLCADLDGVVRSVFDALHLELPDGYGAPPATFRRQADIETEQWVARFVELRGRPPLRPVASAGQVPRIAVDHVRESLPLERSSGGSRVPSLLRKPLASDQLTGPVDPDGELGLKLGLSPWLRSTRPFSHARSTQVFTPDFYDELVSALRDFRSAGLFTRGIPGYDVTAMALTRGNAGPFSVFMSRPWHDLIARILDVPATGEVNISLHHHAVGSASGSLHNDLNPGWFPPRLDMSKITVHDPNVCDYRTGVTPDGTEAVERVRAVAVIYHLANPPVPAVGGDCGLYELQSDPLDRPAVLAPPANNSLIAFECTPFSYHSFLTNQSCERNSLVMWLHRSREDAVDRFGEASIVGW